MCRTTLNFLPLKGGGQEGVIKQYNPARVGSRGDIMVAQLPAIITVLAVVMTFLFAFRTALARAKYKIDAPATTGHPTYERAFRVHMNTVESLVLFLPLLWLGASLYSEVIAFWLGIVWLVGRLAYMVGYMMDPPKRAAGALITMASLAGLLIITVMGLVM